MINIINQTIKVLPDILSQQVRGETVLLDLNGESYFGLDAVGTRIWQLLQEHSDLQKIYDSMLEEYDVEGEQLEKDIDELITKLIEAGLVDTDEA